MTIAVAPAVVERSLDEAGIAFLFAPAFHPSMKHAAPTRRELGASHGVQSARPADKSGGSATRRSSACRGRSSPSCVARALLMLGSERAWVVHGADGLDEISTTGYTKVSEAFDGAVRTFSRAPGRTSACRKTPLARSPAATPRRTAAIMRACSTASRRPRARHRRSSTPARAVRRRPRRRRRGRASRRRDAAIDDAGRPGALDRLVRRRRRVDRSSAHERARRPICSQTIVAATASASRPRARWCPRRRSRRAVGDAPPRARVPGGARRGRTRTSLPSASAGRRRGACCAPTTTRWRSRRATQPAGAAAISVLTEPTFFDGALSHLEAVRARCRFRSCARISWSTLSAARGARRRRRRGAADRRGARATRRLRACSARRATSGLDALVEVHDGARARTALAAGARSIGVNNRNLRTLEVDVDALDQARAAMPPDASRSPRAD